jgi:polysaccharide deacetylase family protein (PEP-CTERM system associated)
MAEEIESRGHEIAFHGYDHEPLWRLGPRSFSEQIERFLSALHSQTKRPVGFRAPNFSLDNTTKWALPILERYGFKYDSSIFPVKTTLYGVRKAPTQPYNILFEEVASESDNGSSILEFPPLVYNISGVRLPVGGGFYFRAIPLSLIERAIRKMNSRLQPAILYLHNWELDPETPRFKLGIPASFITYYNLNKTEKKLRRLLSKFRFTSFRDYIKSTMKERQDSSSVLTSKPDDTKTPSFQIPELALL